MRCETCQGKGAISSTILFCIDCGNTGFAHCCDGIQEQRDPGDETPVWPCCGSPYPAGGGCPQCTGTDDGRIHSPTPEEEQEAWALAHEANASEDWTDQLGQMERDVTGCADDCCHPSHRHMADPMCTGPVWTEAELAVLRSDTHDEWRKLNDG